MFEELFTQQSTIERYKAAPLAEERLRYLQQRAESGTSAGTLERIAASQLRLVGLLPLTDGRTVTVSQVEAAAVRWSQITGDRYTRTTPASAKSRKDFVGTCVQWLRFINQLKEPTPATHPHSAKVHAYEVWMRNERGLSDGTIEMCCGAADEFFFWLTSRDIPLHAVKMVDIDSAIAAKNARRKYSRTTIRMYARGLRSFFGFAEERGWCAPGLSMGILSPRDYPQEGVPRGLAREDVQRLLATTEGSRPADKRDRAILMLLVAYGLRSREIRGLQLDDLNWEKETLRVYCPKTGRTLVYPLSRGVGQAILRYILEVRPSRPERSLFFSLAAPFRPLSGSAVGHVVRSRMSRLGLFTGRRGPHTLRHAAAQHLLNHGMSLKVIGDYLGHRNPSTTAIYAKVDVKSLREVADFDLEGLA